MRPAFAFGTEEKGNRFVAGRKHRLGTVLQPVLQADSVAEISAKFLHGESVNYPRKVKQLSVDNCLTIAHEIETFSASNLCLNFAANEH